MPKEEELLESSIQSIILKHLNSIWKLKVIKIIAATENGISDLLVCYEGRFIAIEVKQEACTEANPLQITFLNDIILAGGQAIVANCLDDVKLVLKDNLAGKELFTYKKLKDFKCLI